MKPNSSKLFTSLASLKDIIKENHITKIFLVTGSKSYSDTPIKQKIEKHLTGYSFKRYSDFNTNPGIEDIISGVKALREYSPDIVIAVGGGSVIDTAKLISLLPDNKEEIEKVIKGKTPPPKRKIPFISIPTTAGSGSEATQFAVIYDNLTKYSVAHDNLIPDYVILEPSLLSSLPKRQRMISAFDALGQAIEAYWSSGSTEESRGYSKESMGLILSVYENLINDPSQEDLAKIIKASYLAGKAINITKTTAPHAVSYTLTMKHNTPHGYAVILTLPYFYLLNAEASEEQISPTVVFAEHNKRMKELTHVLASESPKEAAEKISNMVRIAGFPVALKDLGVKKEDLSFIADNVNLERLKNHPVIIEKTALKSLLENVYEGTIN